MSEGKRDFGNEQDMPVADKLRPTLGPTEEAQDVATLNRITVPMGAFTDPHAPEAASGSVNLPLDKHPVTHSEDYSETLSQEGMGEHSVDNAMSVHSAELREIRPDGSQVLADPRPALEEAKPKRSDWNKSDWQSVAAFFELPTSGNKGAVQKRVEERESEIEAAKEASAEDWKNDIEKAETTEDLAELRRLYGLSGADYSTVAEAFDKREQELAQENAGNGNGDQS